MFWYALLTFHRVGSFWEYEKTALLEKRQEKGHFTVDPSLHSTQILPEGLGTRHKELTREKDLVHAEKLRLLNYTKCSSR